MTNERDWGYPLTFETEGRREKKNKRQKEKKEKKVPTHLTVRELKSVHA